MCENRGGRPGLPSLTILTVSLDIKQHVKKKTPHPHPPPSDSPPEPGGAHFDALHDGVEADVIGTGALPGAAQAAEEVAEGEAVVGVGVVGVGQSTEGLPDEVGARRLLLRHRWPLLCGRRGGSRLHLV